MGYRVRPSAQGGDRRHNRSLADILSAGRGEDELYDEAVGPQDTTRRPPVGEWESDDVYMPEDKRMK